MPVNDIRLDDQREGSGITRRQTLRAVGAGVILGTVPTIGGVGGDRGTFRTVLAANAGETTQNVALSWFGAMGTHYRLDTGRWLGLTRDLPRPNAAIGFIPDVTDEPHAGIAPVTGRFSSEERYHDFTGTITGVDFLSAQQNAVANGIDLVWLTGAINYVNRPEWVAFLLANGGKYFKDVLYEAVTLFNTAAGLVNRSDTAYWEIGNENNSTKFFALTDHGDPQFNNLAHADDYVDFYLTPALDAIYTASDELYAMPRRVKVLSANVSGARGETAAFQDYILNRQITQADRIQEQTWMLGKQVWEVIDRFSLHYAIHLANDGGASDLAVLEERYTTWVASGKTLGFFNTEELGSRGLGAYDVAKIAFRYLAGFWLGKSWDEHAARMCYWGDTTDDPPGTDAQRLLGPFLRDWPLSRAGTTGEVAVNATEDWESYSIRATTPDGHWRYAVHIMPIEGFASTLQSVRVFYQPGGPTNLVWRNVALIDTVNPPDDTIVPEDVIVDQDGILIVLNKTLNMNESYLIRVALTP